MARLAAEGERIEDRFLSALSRLGEPSTNGASSDLVALRRQALHSFAVQGFPRPRTEAWKYTNLRSVLRRPIARDTPAEAAPDAASIAKLDAHLLVVVNGRFSAELSQIGPLPGGVVLGSLADASRTHEAIVLDHLTRHAGVDNLPFVALNTAALEDGAFVYVPPSVSLDRAVHVVHVATASFFQPRTLVVADKGARLSLVSTSDARAPHASFGNAVTEVSVGRRAQVDLFQVQTDSATVSTVSAVHVRQDSDSRFGTHTFTFGGEIVRNNLTIAADAQHCETQLNGLFLARGKSHVDNHTLMDHTMPDCLSSELYKGILDENATGVFNGKVHVRQDAQRINAYQTSKAVVLSRKARMYAKPELEIYADDVKCSHGATTGQLDKDALFYLQARGLRRKQARALLLESFAREVIDPVSLPALRQHLERLVASWLAIA